MVTEAVMHMLSKLDKKATPHTCTRTIAASSNLVTTRLGHPFPPLGEASDPTWCNPVACEETLQVSRG
eukprot:2587777-Amphidinium_carterae.1